jgi:hypothetical protein
VKLYAPRHGASLFPLRLKAVLFGFSLCLLPSVVELAPKKTELVLSQLNKTGSYSPGSYSAITFHASYILAVASKYAKKPA